MVRDRADEWAELSERDRHLITREAIEHWTDGLYPDDWTLAGIAQRERHRIRALDTWRSGAILTDEESALERLLQRNEGRVVDYYEIAQRLFNTATYKVSRMALVSSDGFSTPLMGRIHQIMCNLRKKREIDPIRPQHFANIRGVGYRYYSARPSLNDGEDYRRRDAESALGRERMRREFGLIEGEFVAFKTNGDTYETQYSLEPEYPPERPRRQLEESHAIETSHDHPE